MKRLFSIILSAALFCGIAHAESMKYRKLSTDSVVEGTNKYYTDARVRTVGVDATNAGVVPASGTPVARNFARAAATTGAVAWDTIQAADVPTLNQSTSGTAAGLSAVLVPSSGGTGVANNAASTVTISGSYPLTLTLGGTAALTVPHTAYQLLYASAADTVIGLATSASGVLVTDGSGIPSISTTLPAHITTLSSSSANAKTLDLESTNTATTGNTAYSLYNSLTSSAVVTGTNQTLYGSYNSSTKTGADTNANTTKVYGVYGTASNTGSTNTGVRQTYGGYFTGTGDTAGTSEAYGIYATATGADTNFAGYLVGGLWTILGAGDRCFIDGRATTHTATSGLLDFQHTTSTNGSRTISVDAINNSATGNTQYGIVNNLASSTVVTGTAQTLYGQLTGVVKSGADTSVDTTTLYGQYCTVTNTGATNAGTKNSYAGYFAATGDTAGTSVAYGLYATATGADTNYAAYFANGTVNVQSLTASSPVFTDASKNLTSSGTIPIANGGTNATSFTASQFLRYNSGGTAIESSGTTQLDLVNAAKGRLIQTVLSLTGTPSDVVLFLIFDRTGAVTALKDYATIGGTAAHTAAISANASTLSPAISGLAPSLSFNGSSTYWEVNDANDLSFGDGLGNDVAFSVVVLANVTDATSGNFCSKMDFTTGTPQNEFGFYTGGSDVLYFQQQNPAYSAYVGRRTAAITSYQGTFATYIGTYSNGKTNGSSKIYINAAQSDTTDAGSGVYLGMTNGTAKVGSYWVAAAGTRDLLFNGKGGVVIIYKKELTAAQVAQLDAALRSFAGSDLN